MTASEMSAERTHRMWCSNRRWSSAAPPRRRVSGRRVWSRSSNAKRDSMWLPYSTIRPSRRTRSGSSSAAAPSASRRAAAPLAVGAPWPRCAAAPAGCARRAPAAPGTARLLEFVGIGSQCRREVVGHHRQRLAVPNCVAGGSSRPRDRWAGSARSAISSDAGPIVVIEHFRGRLLAGTREIVEQAGQFHRRCTGFCTTWVPDPPLAHQQALVDKFLDRTPGRRPRQVSAAWPARVRSRTGHRAPARRRGWRPRSPGQAG